VEEAEAARDEAIDKASGADETMRLAKEIEVRWRQGVTLVHLSAQPESFLSRETLIPPSVSHN